MIVDRFWETRRCPAPWGLVLFLAPTVCMHLFLHHGICAASVPFVPRPMASACLSQHNWWAFWKHDEDNKDKDNEEKDKVLGFVDVPCTKPQQPSEPSAVCSKT